MKKNIAVLPGDGIGPEVVKQGVRTLKKIAEIYDHEFIFKYGLIGAIAIEKTGNPLPEKTLQLCKKSDAILFGAIGDPKYDNNPSARVRPEQGLLKMRKSLGLFANLRPVKIFPELISSSPLKEKIIRGTDFIVIRELTGGIYFGFPRKRINNGTTAIDTSRYSVSEITRIAKYAFELALQRKKKVTSVDKANVLETSRLWRETVIKISKNYPSITLNHMFVDNAAMQIIKRPTDFDVILTENMFGDILTDESSVLAGSIGMLPSASIGNKTALYEPIHGSYPNAKGLNTANPLATILSVALMLKISFNLNKECQSIEKAVTQTIKEGYRTYDIADNQTPKKKILGTEEICTLITKKIF